MSAYSTDYAAMGIHGVNAFDLALRTKTPEQIKHDAHRADMLARYYSRKAKEKATRVNPETHWAEPSGEALHRKEIRKELLRTA